MRDSHTATLLSDGRVLLVGGFLAASTYRNTAEIFNPLDRRTFVPPRLHVPSRINHTATLLRDGRVLVAGGATTGGSTVAAAEIFDPTAGTFATTVSTSPGREQHTAALLRTVRCCSPEATRVVLRSVRR